MSYGKIDLNDAVVSPFFVIASGVQVGLFSFTLFGIDFASSIFDIGPNASLSIAGTIAMVSIIAAYVSNRPNMGKMGFVETWVAGVTVVLVFSNPVVPALDALFGASKIVGLTALVVQAGGFYVLSYLG